MKYVKNCEVLYNQSQNHPTIYNTLLQNLNQPSPDQR